MSVLAIINKSFAYFRLSSNMSFFTTKRGQKEVTKGTKHFTMLVIRTYMSHAVTCPH